MEGERVPKNWGVVTETIGRVFDSFVNLMVELVNWLTLVENFVCNEAYFELYPIFDREPVEFFQLRGNVRVFGGTGDNPVE